MIRRIGQLIEHGVGGFFAHGCTQRAAAISFYALFSIFPLAILSVAVLGLVKHDDAARHQVVTFLLDRLPLTETGGRRQLERAMLHVTRDVAGFSALGIFTLLFAASNVMGSIRQALNAAFRVEETRPPAQAKLWDLFMVLVFGALITVSLALTLIDNVIDDTDSAFVDAVQGIGRLAPLLIAVLVFAGIFRFVPAKRPKLRDIWPGVALAAVGYELAKIGFTVYLKNFANYGAVYASLGAVVAFLVFTYITAFIALLGAEFAAEWPCVRDGDYDGPPGPPFSRQVAEFVAGLFVRR
ncbi:MAG: rane protein [Solirubrobacteraceae bacterium]|jgi:membrane protein|nr:rane protein [Solirubrobacteraceae bacterium]